MIAFVDYRISPEEINSLKNLDILPILIPKCSTLYESINGHVDIQLIGIDKSKKTVIVQRDMPIDFLNQLSSLNIKYILSARSLEEFYPNNIFLNAFITDEYLIHNLNHTDPILLDMTKNKQKINIKQGYSKCSILPLNNNALITNDKGIYNTLSPLGFDVLLLPPGDIILEPFDYGFIGGVGGMISNNRMAFFGNLDQYKYGNEVKDFLSKYNIEPIYLREGKLIDRGSLISF